MTQFFDKVRPLGDRVALRVTKREEMVGSIIIPETASDQTPVRRAEVIAVGPGEVVNGKRVELSLKQGDQVLFGKYSGTEVEISGEKIVIAHAADLLAVVESDGT